MLLNALRSLFGALALVVSQASAGAGQAPVLIGLDAEFGHKTSTSAQAIQQGIEIAIDEDTGARGPRLRPDSRPGLRLQPPPARRPVA
ncbi:hypothetical protein [Aromatoleum toluclasticum]|uniref:hypothetical protein n=1 Tax=Aromatoleum toluclasticum TaxID=92003 RepID=UPI0012F9FE90|nr:hypothetical protein [Aromatoleum toluclasticum]